MGFAYILVAILSAAVAVFALQNNTPLSVRFLGWTLPEVPLAGAILASLITGMVVTAIPLMISRWTWRRRARALETKVDMLEAALATRETALLTPRPATPPPTPPRVQSA
jgi:uncharacterized integral membrane protein